MYLNSFSDKYYHQYIKHNYMSDFINNFINYLKALCLFFVRLPKKTTSKQWIPLIATLPISKQSFLHGKL